MTIAPVGSLASQVGASPLKGGDAGPSSAELNNRVDFGSVYANVTTGAGLFLSIAVIIGLVLWYKKTR